MAVASGDVPPFFLRQMLALNDAELSGRIAAVWGSVQAPSADKAARIARYKAMLTPEAVRRADPVNGRRVFARTCAACHVLFDAGARIGPELTGSQRANVDYILENVLDPSAVVADVYRVTLVTLKDGRLVSGVVTRETDAALTLQSQSEAVTVPKEEIAERAKLANSLMPEGLLDRLTPDEVRDLAAYLASPGQVSLPPGPK